MAAAMYVQLQALDGAWETCGVDSPVRVPPESLECVADGGGPKTASFELKRDPSAPWPDIGPFTPVNVFSGGELVWDGRINGTPSRDGADQVMSVQCVGWQHHLDDDLIDGFYVHRRLADWKDARGFSDENLTLFTTAGSVEASGGMLTLGWPSGAVLPAGANVGVKLDLGPGCSAESIAVEVKGITGAANSGGSLFVTGSATSDYWGSGGNTPPFSPTLASIGTNANLYQDDFPDPTKARFVTIGLYVPSGVTLNGDVMLQIRDVAVVSSPGYLSSGSSNSTLLASDVVRDALTIGTVKLSDDLSAIEDTSFVLPEFAPDGRRTPRELIDAVNAFHGWDFHLAPGRRPVFRPMPNRPSLQLGSTSGYQLDDSNQGSADDIYNGVIVTGTDPGGQPVRVERRSSFVDPDGFRSDPGLVWPNPSFATNTTDWSSGGGTLTRTTTSGEYDTGPAGGKFVSTTLLGYAETDANGNLVPGKTYRARVRVKAAASPTTCFFGLNDPTAGPYVSISNFILGTSWETIELYYTARRGDGGVRFRVVVIGSPSPKTIYLDSLQIDVASKTVVDRLGFLRRKEIQLGFTVPSDGVAAAQIGDVWLANHTTTGFKGTTTVAGAAVEERASGQKIPAASLLTRTNELLHFADRIDPVTGAAGRNARIAEVSWKAAEDTATITMDSKLGNLDELLGRLAVVMGQPA